MSPRRLTPGRVAKSLFVLDPDRDERASQLCMEALLTLAQNGFAAPQQPAMLRSPKRRRFALRSLALGQNFLDQRTEGRAGDEESTPQRYGEQLVAGAEIRGSQNLKLARSALQGLIDPSTQRGQPGSWLLFPFHESLLWYDARRQRGRPWVVRKVYMRGSGITLARLLVDPPDGIAREPGAQAVAAMKAALQASSPLGVVADRLEGALPPQTDPDPDVEEDEREAWEAGGSPELAGLAERLSRHCEGILRQGAASGPARLWQLRIILGLDFAWHTLRTAWEVAGVPAQERYLLLTFGGPARAENRVRQRSEDAYQRARIAIREATMRTLGQLMQQLAEEEGPELSWSEEFEARSRLDHVAERLALADRADQFDALAREAFEDANYDRPGDGFRVLLESAGLLTGTGAYRYLSATPDLLSAMVGALSACMPMTSSEFWALVFQEWGLVVAADALGNTDLRGQLDGADLERNARRAEQIMVDAGLALALSDRTTLVGERARRQE